MRPVKVTPQEGDKVKLLTPSPVLYHNYREGDTQPPRGFCAQKQYAKITSITLAVLTWLRSACLSKRQVKLYFGPSFMARGDKPVKEKVRSLVQLSTQVPSAHR